MDFNKLKWVKSEIKSHASCVSVTDGLVDARLTTTYAVRRGFNVCACSTKLSI